MEKFYAVTLVVHVILVINLFLAVGAWFSYQAYQEGYTQIMEGSEVPIEFNESDFQNLSESLGTNYGIGAGEGILDNAHAALFQIPITINIALEIAQIPVSLKDLIVAALYSLLGFCYIIFGFEIWSYIRGYGGA